MTANSSNIEVNTEERPWGNYTVLYDSPDCKVKTITVYPGHRLSLQMHHHRVEHWVIISGKGLLTLNDEETVCEAGSSIYVDREMRHRIANIGQDPLVFIEVQRGSYFGEDDIVRFEDDYNRT